jgi:hypothetical protein
MLKELTTLSIGLDIGGYGTKARYPEGPNATIDEWNKAAFQNISVHFSLDANKSVAEALNFPSPPTGLSLR